MMHKPTIFLTFYAPHQDVTGTPAPAFADHCSISRVMMNPTLTHIQEDDR